MIRRLEFKINDRPVQLETDDDRLLLWVLRTDLSLTGTKYGCGEGICGACTVIVNGKEVRSCQTTMKEVAGKEVLTIEGLAKSGKLHPLQKAFVENNALQCGFCTSGMIMNAYGLLMANPEPSEGDIIKSMNDNLCRCGAHVRIIKAIQEAAKEVKVRRRR